MTILLFLFSSLGLGHFLMEKRVDRFWPGVQAFLGFSLITILIFLLNMLLPISLRTSALTVFALSVVGFVLFVKDHYRHLNLFVRHPLFIFGIPVTILFILFGWPSYFIQSWDEFSHWITMPKQMFLHQSLLSSDFHYPQFASYTPGWPLLLLYKSILFLDHFEIESVVFIPLFSTIVCMAAAYDIASEFDFLKKANSYFAYMLIPLMAFTIFLKPSFHADSVLIEVPMYHAILIIFLLCYLLFQSQKSSRELIWIGIIAGHAYLLKSSFMALIPILILTSIKIKNPRSLLFTLLPITISYFTWRYQIKSAHFTQMFTPVTFDNLTDLLAHLESRLPIFKNFPLKHNEMINYTGRFKTIITLVGFAWFFRRNSNYSLRLALFYFVFYWFTLICMYFVSFSDHEGINMASFDRYMSIPLLPLQFFGALWLAIFIPSLIKIKWNKYILFLIIIFSMGHRHSYRFSKRTTVPNPMLHETQTLVETIKDRNLNMPTVLFVSQTESYRFEIIFGRFASMGNDRYWFNVSEEGTSFAEVPQNIWQRKISKEEMLTILGKVQILWIVRSDSWMDSILDTLKKGDCPKPYDRYFIFKNGDMYDCIPKK